VVAIVIAVGTCALLLGLTNRPDTQPGDTCQVAPRAAQAKTPAGKPIATAVIERASQHRADTGGDRPDDTAVVPAPIPLGDRRAASTDVPHCADDASAAPPAVTACRGPPELR
jgi:hypothetical protein